MDKARLVDRIRSGGEAITAFTERLVCVPTENPPGTQYAACARVLVEELGRLGLPAESIEGPEGRVVVRSFVGEPGPTLYFHGHYDVVPAQDPAQFTPVRRNECLFGRGSADMKGGVALMVYAAAALKGEEGFKGRVGLTLVPDEETGGRFGSRHLADAGLLGENGIGMLTAEPTGGEVWNACRGAISLRVRVKGRPAHVGLHFRGQNAFERALPITDALLNLKREIEARKTTFAIAPEAARSSILMLGGEVSGGANFNVVPDEFVFSVERRFNPEESLGEEKGRLLGLLEGARKDGTDLDIEMIQEASSSAVDEESPLGRTLAASAREATGRTPPFALCPGLLENRFYAERGIPAVAFGPGLLSVSHGPNEYVRIPDLAEYAAVYALTAVNLFGA